MYIRDMGSPGQHNELTVGGVDERGIAFLVDGRSQADPITGAYDMILFPTDYIERIEFITGPRAMLYGMNSTGGAINIVTKSFYTNKPYDASGTARDSTTTRRRTLCSAKTFSRDSISCSGWSGTRSDTTKLTKIIAAVS